MRLIAATVTDDSDCFPYHASQSVMRLIVVTVTDDSDCFPYHASQSVMRLIAATVTDDSDCFPYHCESECYEVDCCHWLQMTVTVFPIMRVRVL